jgi:4-amino-4-deoxy-L-arabinose transferase-like glycosyltransferase
LLYATTVLATHKIAELLFDADTAKWAVVLLTLHYGFTRRTQLYNHNSVLIAFVAVTVLLTVYALRDQKTWQWMWVGLMAGLSTLVKYQALVAFLGVLVAIASAGKLKASARGLGWAGVVSVLTLTPHGLWLLEHDFKPVRYAMSFLTDPDWMETTQRQASFWVAQLRFHLPMLFFMALIGAWKFIRHEEGSEPQLIRWRPEQKAWVWGLCAFPLVTIVFVAWAMGARIQSQWGLQLTQFLCLPLAHVWVQKFGPLNLRHLWAWGVVQVMALLIFVGQATGMILYANDRLAVRELPARHFATQALDFWRAQSPCPLIYLSGESAMSAMISAYSGQHLNVLEDQNPEKSPWIDVLDLQRRGYLEVLTQSQASTELRSLSLPYRLRSRKPHSSENTRYLVLRYHAPQMSCP